MVSVRSKSRAEAKRSVPPPRVRHEEANPAVPEVIVRISRGLRDELATLKQEHGLALGGVLRVCWEAQASLKRQKRRPHAIQDITEPLQRNPDYAEALAARAEACQQLGDLAAAEAGRAPRQELRGPSEHR